MSQIDATLASFATVRQLEILEAVAKHGSHRKAAKALGVNPRTLDKSMAALRFKAAQQGHSPAHDMTKLAPAGFNVKGVSSYYGQDGELKGQWVKTSADQAARDAAVKEAFEVMAQELPRLTPVSKPTDCAAALCNVYTFTDSHVGAMCWAEETGADWNLELAEATLMGCFERMIQGSPKARTGILAQLGDFLHQDGISPVTPTSGHILDADGRFSQVVAVAVKILRRAVDMLLKRHELVVVLLAEGNHDISSSIWLRVMFKALYEHEPRVMVIDSPLPYYVWQHGQTMLAWHHGHLKKNDQLPLLFASAFAREWGSTTKRYAHCGHRHHVEEKEHSGMTVVQHPTLAARDAYAARGGWFAERQVRAISYHSSFGEVGRMTVTPEMLAV